MSKNLIIFMPSIEGGGVEKNLFAISDYLSHHLPNLSIISLSKSFKKKFNKNINFISLKNNFWDTIGRRKKFIVSLFILTVEILRKRGKVVVFCFQGNIYCTILCKILGVKIIVRSNSAPDGWSQNIFKFFCFKYIFKLADKIIVNSIDFKKKFKKKFNLDVEYIYNPLNTIDIKNRSKLKTKYRYPNKRLKIINIGRFTDQKDQITILKALNLIKKKVSFFLYIMGRGIEKKNLIKFITDNNLSKNVKVINFQSNPFSLLKKSNLFILSSIYEGLPNVLLEALVLKKFIISSDCPTGPREILLNGKGGILFTPRNHHQLAKKIYQYSINTSKFKHKVLYATKNLDRFDQNLNLKKYLTVVKKFV